MFDRRLLVAFAIASIGVQGATARAQAPGATDPIGPVAIDVRGSLPRFKADNALAEPFGLIGLDLPTRGLGVDLGAHWYPLAAGPVTFGLGGSILVARGHKGPSTTAGTTGADVTERLTAFSPQVSFNFGRGKGWSYLSGGLGGSRLTLETPEFRASANPLRKTINYGGGARWFLRDHLAFTFDVRFYAINPQPATTTTVAAPRLTLTVISAGVSFK
jgi:hypothetical protein